MGETSSRRARPMLRQAAGLACLALAAAGCTTPAPAGPTAEPAASAAANAAEAADCESPSRIREGDAGDTEVEGSSHDGLTLYGQVQAGNLLEPSEATKKIVWRITGTGTPELTVVDPRGERSAPEWGPEYHPSSNYARPGDEYGAGFILDEPGCWQIEFTRDTGTASAWLRVRAP